MDQSSAQRAYQQMLEALAYSRDAMKDFIAFLDGRDEDEEAVNLTAAMCEVKDILARAIRVLQNPKIARIVVVKAMTDPNLGCDGSRQDVDAN